MTRKRKTQNPYDEYRAEAYGNVAARGGGRIDDLEDVVDELLRITPDEVIDDANRAAAWLAVDTEDGVRTTPPPWEHQLMLPGWPDPIDSFWKVGDGQRVRVGDASATDHLTHIQLVEENERKVADAARAARDRYWQLAPYYGTGSATVADAAARWLADHP